MKLYSVVLGAVLIGATTVQLSLRGHPCFPREEIVSRLKGKFNESLRGIGYNSQGNLVELWIHEKEKHKTESWTLLITLPNGDSCVAQMGTVWSVIPHVHNKRRASR